MTRHPPTPPRTPHPPRSPSTQRSRSALSMARLVLFITCAGIIAWWSFKPLTTRELPTLASVEPTVSGPLRAAAFDADAFAAPIWVAPPPPPPPPPAPPPPVKDEPPPPPPPLKHQLLSILQGPDGPRALLYDPDTHTILTLGVGDPLGTSADGRTLASISEGEVTIRGTRGTKTLSLRDPPATGRTARPR
jgi:hypothetical protein